MIKLVVYKFEYLIYFKETAKSGKPKSHAADPPFANHLSSEGYKVAALDVHTKYYCSESLGRQSEKVENPK